MSSFTLNNKTYDTVKHLVQVVLPALGALYFGLSQTLGLPAGEEVVGTITLITAFLGTALGISSRNYEEPTDGDIVVEQREDGPPLLTLQLNDEAHTLAHAQRLVFTVKDRPEAA